MAIRPIYGCAGLSVGFVLLSTVLFLGTVGRGSTFAFWSLFPGIWLTSTIAGPIIATSDSGPTNLVAITLYQFAAEYRHLHIDFPGNS